MKDEIHAEQISELLKELSTVIVKAVGVGCDNVGLHNPQSRLYLAEQIFALALYDMMVADAKNQAFPN